MGSSLELSVFDKHCIDTLLLGVNSSSEFVSAMKARGRELIIQEAVAQNPFRSLKIIFDHSNVRFTKNGYQKFFNVRSRDMGNSPLRPDPQETGNGGLTKMACDFYLRGAFKSRIVSIHAIPLPFMTRFSFTLSGFSPFFRKNGVSSVVHSVVPVSGV